MKGLLALSFIVLFTSSMFGQTIISVQDGDWDEESTWNLTRIPLPTDFVKINHNVLLTIPDVVVDSLEISNYSRGAGLEVDVAGNFSVTSQLDVFCVSGLGDAYLIFKNASNIEIDELFIERDVSQPSSSTAKIGIYENSVVTIFDKLIYEYQGFPTCTEATLEFDMADSSDLTVDGHFILDGISGNNFNAVVREDAIITCNSSMYFFQKDVKTLDCDFMANTIVTANGKLNCINTSNIGSKLDLSFEGIFNIGDSLNLTSTRPDNVINFDISGTNSEMHIGSDLNIKAVADSCIMIDVAEMGHVFLGGEVNRDLLYGDLDMGVNAIWEYVSGSYQGMAASGGNGLDSFNFSNVKFNLGATDTLILQGDLHISRDLELGSGIINSSAAAMLIIGDGASITGGSVNSFVNGPVKKIGLTGTDPFIFPIGNKGKYAPMTIESTGSRAPSGEYTASYLNCPPPWGIGIANNLVQISDEDHWVLERSIGSPDVNVSLHWSDAEAQGIYDLSSLVVAMYNPDIALYPGFPAGWTSIGQGTVSGGTGSGISGFVSNIGSCPPPWGIQNFTLGSTDETNALPLEMENFEATINGQVVDISWNSINEVNTDVFMIEKSIDGSVYYQIDKQDAKESIGGAIYSTIDQVPTLGINYYRIKQVDKDGMFSYSKVVSVIFKRENDLSVFPNPIANEFVLRGSILKNAEIIRISDLSGKIITQIPVDSRTDVFNLNLDDYNINNTGFYLLTVQGKAADQSIKIYKK